LTDFGVEQGRQLHLLLSSAGWFGNFTDGGRLKSRAVLSPLNRFV
jgi:hypothetical protein